MPTPSDYDRIAKAIAFVVERVETQPKLQDIAAHVHMSPFHLQRLFSRWAGVSPKRFLQALTLERSKPLLRASESLLDVATEVGLSGSSRLHDHFVQLEAVTPGEYKNRGRGLIIRFGVQSTPFGPMFVAVTDRGVCRAAFVDDCGAGALAKLRQDWPLAEVVADGAATHEVAEAMFDRPAREGRPMSLHVSGTNFQIAVWRALLNIRAGEATSYSQLAANLGRPRSARAIGHAVGANPVAFLIPCHRVIHQSGALGGYRWGTQRKRAIQVWERARLGTVTP